MHVIIIIECLLNMTSRSTVLASAIFDMILYIYKHDGRDMYDSSLHVMRLLNLVNHRIESWLRGFLATYQTECWINVLGVNVIEVFLTLKLG